MYYKDFLFNIIVNVLNRTGEVLYIATTLWFVLQKRMLINVLRFLVLHFSYFSRANEKKYQEIKEKIEKKKYIHNMCSILVGAKEGIKLK